MVVQEVDVELKQDGAKEEIENASSLAGGEEDVTKYRGGIALVPQPSDDPDDPLNWPQRKKYTILAILCLSAFSGMASPLANQLGLVAQSKLYGRPIVEISYSISAAVAGMAGGPLILVPLTYALGRSSIIWWSLIACMCCGIWGALMTGKGDYLPFVLSRFFAGVFGSVPSILGAGVLTDIFFLHERGRAFSTFSLSFLMGTVAGPTFGGFIVQHVYWANELWWTVGLQGLIIILAFFLLEETEYSRPGGFVYPHRLEGFWRNRIATFFPGSKVAPPTTAAAVLSGFKVPLLIGLSPAGLCAGTFTLGFFGWFVNVNTLLTVFLQRPQDEGGYAFTPQRNALFTFSLWIGIICAQVWGFLLNDRIPLLLVRRRGGNWKPEYRLYSLVIPSVIIMPAGLGIFGAALQYHLHYVLLALGSFMVTFASMVSVPIAVNYLTECFRSYPTEVSAIMGLYRLVLGLAVPFFIDQWMLAVDGPGWVFGMEAFFSLMVFCLIVLLMWQGENIRRMSSRFRGSDEDGVQVISVGVH